MKFLFRCDASRSIGSGHVMRCLTLAKALKHHGHYCAFAMQPFDGNLIAFTEAQGFDVHSLEDDGADFCHAHAPDWLIADSYALGATWHQRARAAHGKLMVIDDLANQTMQCDLLLNQNAGFSAASYKALVPPHCQLLLGTRYALLRPEFAERRAESLARRASHVLSHLLISLGGADPDNWTSRILQQLQHAMPSSVNHITVVAGYQNPHYESLCAQAKAMPIACRVIRHAENMAELMCDADFAIGAAGSSAWERCAMGLPSIVLELAENQRPIARAISQAGAGLWLENTSSTEALKTLLSDADLASMSAKAAQLVDGEGARRVKQAILGDSNED